ncbi:MAG: hypothetical protein VB858_17085, partial [Planctomycetaceae bacterium]
MSVNHRPRSRCGLRAEHLEERVLLTTLVNSSEFHAGTGDVFSVDLSDVVPTADTFTITGLNVKGQGETLIQQSIPGQTSAFELQTTGQESAGRLFLSEAIDGTPFSTSGRLAYAPSLLDALGFDGDIASHGFQGTIEMEFSTDTNGMVSNHSVDLIVAPDY